MREILGPPSLLAFAGTCANPSGLNRCASLRQRGQNQSRGDDPGSITANAQRDRPKQRLVVQFRSSYHIAARSFTSFGIKGALATPSNSPHEGLVCARCRPLSGSLASAVPANSPRFTQTFPIPFGQSLIAACEAEQQALGLRIFHSLCSVAGLLGAIPPVLGTIGHVVGILRSG